MSIIFNSPINSLSYGICGLNVLKELNKRELVGYWPIGQCEVTNRNDADLVNKCIENQTKCKYDDVCIRLYHQFALMERVGRGLTVGWPIFELDTFNEKELFHLKSCDKLIVCSKWAKQVLLNNGIECPIHICPLGVDTTVFDDVGNTWGQHPKTDKFVILNVGKWERRKLMDIFPQILERAFSVEDDVELWLCPTNIFNNQDENEQWLSFYRNSSLADKVRILPRFKTQDELAKIYQQCSVYLGISRAEGWNFPNIEAMACGKYVVTTNCTAHTEYANEYNSFLVDIDNYELAYDSKFFFGQGSWASFEEKQIEQTVHHLRTLYDIWKENHCMWCNFEGVKTARKFSWENTVDKMLEVINND